MEADILLDYEAAGEEQRGLRARVKSPAGGDYQSDLIEVALPERLALPVDYAKFRDVIENYYRDAAVSAGWGSMTEGSASVENSIVHRPVLASYEVDAEARPPRLALEASQPVLDETATGPDWPFERFEVFEDIGFKDQDVHLDGRTFRNCTFLRCHIHVDVGAFVLSIDEAYLSRPVFDTCGLATGPRARAVLELVDLFRGRDQPPASGLS